MAGRSSKPNHRAETSTPATSVAVAAARAGDTPRAQQRRELAPAAALRRSAAFPPRRQQHLHQRCDSERIRQPRCGEVAGGTAAGCAAVCCCFPCAVVEVVVLATVRAPAALCRRAVRARRRRRSASAGQAAEMYELLVDDGGVAVPGEAAAVWPAMPQAEEAGELEREVWATFYGAGFWRSPSQLGDEISAGSLVTQDKPKAAKLASTTSAAERNSTSSLDHTNCCSSSMSVGENQKQDPQNVRNG